MPVILLRVVCALSETMLIFCPTMRFINVDFPTFGEPIIVTNPDLYADLFCVCVIVYSISFFENARGRSSPRERILYLPSLFMQITGISASQNSASTCLHTPHGAVKFSLSEATAIAEN